jgi:hypothetical protein
LTTPTGQTVISKTVPAGPVLIVYKAQVEYNDLTGSGHANCVLNDGTQPGEFQMISPLPPG